MAEQTLTQFKDPASKTYFGVDVGGGQAKAYSNEQEFLKDFPTGFNQNAPAANFDTANALANPNTLVPFKVPEPKTFPAPTVDTAFNTGAPTADQIRKTIVDSQASSDKMLADIQTFFTPSAEEAAAAKDVANLDAERRQYDINTQKALADREGGGVDARLVTGAQEQILKQRSFGAQEIDVKRGLALQTLQSVQASRQQKLDAAKFLYDATKSNLKDTLALYQATAPENIGTKVDEATGDLYVMSKNPLTGQVYVQKAGNVGASKSYQSTSIKVDENTGDTVFYGIKPDGTVETKVLTKGEGNLNEKKAVQDLANKYPDAGISLTDTLTAAQAKLNGSKIYKEQTRAPQNTTVNTANLNRQALTLAQNELSKPGYYGTDGYLDPATYMKLRTDYAVAIGDPSKFDEVFAAKLSPQERARLGVGKATGVQADGSTGQSKQKISDIAKGIKK